MGFNEPSAAVRRGGVISPLLALIALQGIEPHIKRLGTKAYPVYVVADADDMVILARRENDIHRAQAAPEKWLHKIGLELNPQKTTRCHTLHGEHPGFEFLGFQVQQHPIGKYRAKRGHKTLITPSKKGIKRHLARLKQMIQVHRGPPTQH